VAVGARELQVIGAHDFVPLHVDDLTVEDLHADAQLVVARLVRWDLVEGMAQHDRLVERNDLVPWHGDGVLAAARGHGDGGDDGVLGVVGDEHVGELADGAVAAVDHGAADQFGVERHGYHLQVQCR